jgi:CheY-like chemotaxis protein
MISKELRILLADDDMDDCLLFQDALSELSIPTTLRSVRDGDELLIHINQEQKRLPDVLFLDLNMPRKNGFECLAAIKNNENLRQLPVIIFSTSINEEIVRLVYKSGAAYFIRKPNEFSKLKKVILQAINLVIEGTRIQPSLENFVLKI